MELYDAQRILQGAAREGLPELSIENLKCGRITRQVIALCLKRWQCVYRPTEQFAFQPQQEVYFADWLNDLLEAGQVVRHHERVTVCAEAMKENEVEHVNDGNATLHPSNQNHRKAGE